MKITLRPGEHIAAVVPEYVSGPGWSNRPLWVHIHNNGAGTFRTECIQPDEQTPEQQLLFKPGAAMCDALIDIVQVRRAKK